MGSGGGLNLRLHGVEVEARALLEGRIFYSRLGQLRHLLLHEHEAPELIHERIHEEALGAVQGSVNRITQSLEGVQSQVGQAWCVDTVLGAEPAIGLLNETILPVVDAHCAEIAFAEVEDLVAGRGAFASEHCCLVVAIEVIFVGHVSDLLALEQLVLDVRIASGGDECWEPVEARDDAILNHACGDFARPANHRRGTETAFVGRALLAFERRVAAVRPGEGLGAVIGGEKNDGAVVLAHVIKLLQDQADVVIELGHAGFLDGPAVLRVSHFLVLVREMGDDVHPGRIDPAEERLAVRFGLVNELQCDVTDFVVHGFHPLGKECACVFDFLFADLSPARHLGGVILISGPAMDHVARADDVQQLLWIAWVRGVFHRIEVIEVDEELIEAMHGRQVFIEIAEVVFAKLAGGLIEILKRACHRASRSGHPDFGSRLADGGQAGADGQLAGDEGCAPRRATRFSIVVSEKHAFFGEHVEVGRPASHHATVVSTDVPDADVVTHDDDDVRLFGLSL